MFRRYITTNRQTTQSDILSKQFYKMILTPKKIKSKTKKTKNKKHKTSIQSNVSLSLNNI